MLGWITVWMAASASEVELDLRRYEALLPAIERPEEAPDDRWAARRDVVIGEADGQLVVDVTWALVALEDGWVDLPLAPSSWRVEEVRVDGRPARTTEADGRVRLVMQVDEEALVTGRFTLPGSLRAGVELALLPGVTGTVQAPGAMDVRVDGASVARVDGVAWTGAGVLSVREATKRSADGQGLSIVGQVGIGVTVADDAVRVRGRVGYRVTGGAVESVQLDVGDAGNDLEIEGKAVAGWTRSGSVVTVRLNAPEDRAVDLDVRWSAALPDRDEVQGGLPSITPLGTYRIERGLQVARDGDREVLPELGSWTGVASADLPEVARGLVEGTPTSAWVSTGDGGGSLGFLRFRPVSGPPTMIDVAAFEGVLSEEGRLLYRMHYTVRNDRGDVLRVRLPDGQRLVSAQVGKEPARVARDGDELLIPLQKSVETVEGLLDFPVRLVVLGDGQPFDRKELRAVPLPSVDAPIAASRVELRLPEGWESRLEAGEHGVVDAFSEGEGITYGFRSGDANVARADALYQDAVEAWMDNRFEEAQGSLDELRALGAENANISRLQSNLDVVAGKNDDQGSEALSRRVKDQAMARARRDLEEQERLLEEADKSYDAGDYEAAEQTYQAALDIGNVVQQLEQKEAREVASSNAGVLGKLSKAKKAKKSKERVASEDVREEEDVFVDLDVPLVFEDGEKAVNTASTATGTVLSRDMLQKVDSGGAVTEIDFQDIEVSGELAKPSGALMLDRKESSEEPAGFAWEAPPQPRQNVGAGAGGDPRIGGAAANENTFMISSSPVDPSYESTAQPTQGDEAPATTITSSQGTVLTRESLENVPRGRSYQVATQMAAGVGVGAGAGGNPNIGGAASSPVFEAESVPEPLLDGASAGRSYQDVVVQSRGRRVRIGLGARKRAPAKSAVAPMPPPPPAPPLLVEGPPEPVVEAALLVPTDDDAPGDSFGAPPAPVERFEALQVRAVDDDVVLPPFGEKVLYQRLLLPAGAAPEVLVEARTKRGRKP